MSKDYTLKITLIHSESDVINFMLTKNYDMDKMKFTIISVNNSTIPLEIHTTEKVKAPSIRSKFLICHLMKIIQIPFTTYLELIND